METQKILELEQKLAAAQEKIHELEKELGTLRARASKQNWIENIKSDEWLIQRSISEVTNDRNEQDTTRIRTKTVIDTSVIEELRIEKKDIQLKEHIGKGSFGIVWKANYKDSNVAVKVFVSEEVDVSREISTMAKTRGLAHILDLIGVVLEEDDPYKPSQIALVMKYMSNGSLQDICYKESNSYHSNLTNEMKLKFCYQAAKGVANLHSKHIIHRDLACRNLLVDDKLDIYVADFGFARLKQVTNSKEFTTTKLGPVRWEAPESLQNKEYSEKTDSFSFGICIYEIIVGKQPWDFCPTPMMVALNVLRGDRLNLPINCDPILADIAWKCWNHEPYLRPNFATMVSILGDRYKQVMEDTRQIEKELLCIEFMIIGVDVLKFPFLKSDEKLKFKKPQYRFLRLKSNLKSIVWRSSTANSVFSSASRNKVVERGINIHDILEVKVGYSTENFRLQTSQHHTALTVSCSFSIITTNRSVDITCENSTHRDLWVRGIRYLLNRSHDTHSSTSSPMITNLKLFYLSPTQSLSLHSLQKLTFSSLPINPNTFQSHEYLTVLRSLVYRLQRGDIIVKFKSNRKLHAKRIYLSPDLTELVWNMRDEEEGGGVNKRSKNKSILLAEIDNLSYEPPNFYFGNSRVAAVAANLSESLLRRHHHHSTLATPPMYASSSNTGIPTPQQQSLTQQDKLSKKDRGSVESYDPDYLPKKGRPRKPSADSTGTPIGPGGQATSATWVQALIPSLKREKSEDPSMFPHSPVPPHHLHNQQDNRSSDSDTDARPDDPDQDQPLHLDDLDTQYCISYLRHDGKILLAIQCPNREVFEVWTDGLIAVITGLKHSKSQTIASYNSGTEFTIASESETKEHIVQNSNHAVISQLSRLESINEPELVSPSSEVTEVMHHLRNISEDPEDRSILMRETSFTTNPQQDQPQPQLQPQQVPPQHSQHPLAAAVSQDHYKSMKPDWMTDKRESKLFPDSEAPILNLPIRRSPSKTIGSGDGGNTSDGTLNTEYRPMKGSPHIQKIKKERETSTATTTEVGVYEHKLIDV